MSSSSSRACTKCGIEKPLTANYWQRDRGNKSGFCTICKSCRHEYDWQRDRVRRHTMLRRFTLAAARANYRARALGVFGQLTTHDILHRFARQRGNCYYCSQSIWNRFEVEHVHPLGTAYFCGDNTPGNVVLSCPTCNNQKRDLPPQVFAGKLATRGIRHELLPDGVPVQLSLPEPQERIEKRQAS